MKLQTSIATDTHSYLRLEALRRHLTMGQLLDEIVGRYIDVPETLPN
jgi:hypothetical protein